MCLGSVTCTPRHRTLEHTQEHKISATVMETVKTWRYLSFLQHQTLKQIHKWLSGIEVVRLCGWSECPSWSHHTLLCILFSLQIGSWVAYWSSYISKEFTQRLTLCVPGDIFLLTFFFFFNNECTSETLKLEISFMYWKKTLFFLIPTIISFHECYVFNSSILVVLTLYCLNLDQQFSLYILSPPLI